MDDKSFSQRAFQACPTALMFACFSYSTEAWMLVKSDMARRICSKRCHHLQVLVGCSCPTKNGKSRSLRTERSILKSSQSQFWLASLPFLVKDSRLARLPSLTEMLTTSWPNSHITLSVSNIKVMQQLALDLIPIAIDVHSFVLSHLNSFVRSFPGTFRIDNLQVLLQCRVYPDF